MNASDVMSSPVITVSPATPVPEIARFLLQRRISGVPVVEQGQVVGIVSEADLLRLHEADGLPAPRAAPDAPGRLRADAPGPAQGR